MPLDLVWKRVAMAPAYNPVQSSDLQSQRLQYRKRRRCRGNGLYMTAAAAPAEPEDHAPAHGAGLRRRLLDALASTSARVVSRCQADSALGCGDNGEHVSLQDVAGTLTRPIVPLEIFPPSGIRDLPTSALR